MLKRLIQRAALRLARWAGLSGLAAVILVCGFFNIVIDSVFLWMSMLYDAITFAGILLAVWLGYRLLISGQARDSEAAAAEIALLRAENARLTAQLREAGPQVVPSRFGRVIGRGH